MDAIYVRSSSSEEDEDMPEESQTETDFEMDSSPVPPEIKRECPEIIPKDNAT